MLDSTNILGVNITTSNEDKILEYVVSVLEKGRLNKAKNLPAGRQVVIFTPNPEQISAAARNKDLKRLLNLADVSLPDGVGVVWASRLLGKGIKARISGVDFMENLVKRIHEQPVITGYFGGQRGVAEKAANCLQKMVSPPGGGQADLSVGYASDAYNKEKMIQSDVDILFVGLGFPKQEKWIIEHKDEIPATVIMAVGGSFDFFSGKVSRAPLIVRLFGFEWLFRLIIQPWRLPRQLQLLHFSGIIFQRWLSDRLKILKK